MFRLLTALCLLWMLPGRGLAAEAAYGFEYNAACAAAYRAYLSLHVPEGDALIAHELIAHPYNLAATYVADYGDAVTLLFNGDPYQLQQRAAHEAERLARLAKADDADPWKRLALAGVHLHWSLIKLRDGHQLKAAAGLRRSYLLLRDNAARFPAFPPNDAPLWSGGNAGRHHSRLLQMARGHPWHEGQPHRWPCPSFRLPAQAG